MQSPEELAPVATAIPQTIGEAREAIAAGKMAMPKIQPHGTNRIDVDFERPENKAKGVSFRMVRLPERKGKKRPPRRAFNPDKIDVEKELKENNTIHVLAVLEATNKTRQEKKASGLSGRQWKKQQKAARRQEANG